MVPATTLKPKKSSIGGINFSISTNAATCTADQHGAGHPCTATDRRQSCVPSTLQQEHAVNTGSTAFSAMVQRRASLAMHPESMGNTAAIGASAAAGASSQGVTAAATLSRVSCAGHGKGFMVLV